LTDSHEAEKIRDQIYSLYLKRLTVREIADSVHLSKSQVGRHLATIRWHNAAWFDQHKDPEGRRRALTKEIADQLGETIKETWVLYGKALNQLNATLQTDKSPQGAFATCNAYIRTIISALQQYRLVMQVVAPRMDDVWLKEMMDKVMSEQEIIRKDQEERRMKDKIKPAVLPYKERKQDGAAAASDQNT
jgi:hypothetical protein